MESRTQVKSVNIKMQKVLETQTAKNMNILEGNVSQKEFYIAKEL